MGNPSITGALPPAQPIRPSTASQATTKQEAGATPTQTPTPSPAGPTPGATDSATAVTPRAVSEAPPVSQSFPGPDSPRTRLNAALRENFPDPVQRAEMTPIFRELLDRNENVDDLISDMQTTRELAATGNQPAYRAHVDSLRERAQGRSGVADPALRDALAEVDQIAARNGGRVPLDSTSLTNLMARAGVNVNANGIAGSAEIGASWSRASVSASPVIVKGLVEAAHAWRTNPSDTGAKERFEAFAGMLETLGDDLTTVMGRAPSTPLNGVAQSAGAPVVQPAQPRIGITIPGSTIQIGGQSPTPTPTPTPPPTQPPTVDEPTTPDPGGKLK